LASELPAAEIACRSASVTAPQGRQRLFHRKRIVAARAALPPKRGAGLVHDARLLRVAHVVDHVGLRRRPGRLGRDVAQQRQLPPRVRGQERHLAPVEPERVQHAAAAQLRFRVTRAVDGLHDVLPARKLQHRQLELARVFPEPFVARLRKVLGAHVRVEPVRQRLAQRQDMAARAL